MTQSETSNTPSRELAPLPPHDLRSEDVWHLLVDRFCQVISELLARVDGVDGNFLPNDTIPEEAQFHAEEVFRSRTELAR